MSEEATAESTAALLAMDTESNAETETLEHEVAPPSRKSVLLNRIRTAKHRHHANPNRDSGHQWDSREISASTATAILAFPLTIYIGLATFLLYVLYRLERLARSIAAYHGFKQIVDRGVIAEHGPVPLLTLHFLSPVWLPLTIAGPSHTHRWHTRHPLLALFIPITFPVIGVAVLYVFLLNVFASALLCAWSLTANVWSVVRGMWHSNHYGRVRISSSTASGTTDVRGRKPPATPTCYKPPSTRN